MNKVQLFGVVLVIIGLFLLVVLPIFGIAFGEKLIPLSIVGGWLVAIIGALIAIVSLVFERIGDMKKENFGKNKNF